MGCPLHDDAARAAGSRKRRVEVFSNSGNRSQQQNFCRNIEMYRIVFAVGSARPRSASTPRRIPGGTPKFPATNSEPRSLTWVRPAKETRMSNPNQNPGQQTQNPNQKPGQQGGGQQKPGQQQQGGQHKPGQQQEPNR